MLKAISVTFQLDPELFAKVLTHAGRMTINTVEIEPTETTRHRNLPILTHRKKNNNKTTTHKSHGTKNKIRAYATTHKQFTIADVKKALRLPNHTIHNALHNLTNDKFLRREGRGQYVLVNNNAN